MVLDPNTPNHVWMRADHLNLKAGGTNPFAAPKLWPQWYPGTAPFTPAALRKAHRHGGAIPWDMVTETLPADVTLTDPEADSHYVTEIPGHLTFVVGGYYNPDVRFGLDGVTFTITPPSPGPPPVYDYMVDVKPNPILLSYTSGNSPTALVRSEPPKYSADDPPTQLINGPAGAAVIGKMNRMVLIKPTANGLNKDTLGAQCQYFVRLLAGPYDPEIHQFSNWFAATYDYGPNMWTILKPLNDTFSSQWSFAGMRGDFLHSYTVDDETGKISTATSIPEGSMYEADMRGYFDGFGAYAAAINWPTALRGFFAKYYGTLTDPTNVRICWRPAGPWVIRFVAEWSGGAAYWENADATAIGFGVGTWPYTPSTNPYDILPVRQYYWYERDDAKNATGDWNVLCDFVTPTLPDLGPPTWGTSLPAPGEAIIMTAFHPDMETSGNRLFLTIYPDATVSPVAIPVMHGGVIQGGTL